MENKEKVIANNRFYWLYLIGFFLILALPLLNIPPWFSPPDWGKTIVFRIALSLIIFLFIWQILGQRKFSIKISLALRLLIALFIIFLLANIFSLDRTFSFWGSPYRSGGFVNFAFYIIFAILAFLTISEKDWQKIWDFALVIGGLVSLVAVFQQFNILSKFIIPFESRPPSTIGGSIFLAIYLLLLIFLTTVFGIREKDFKKRLFYFFLLLLFIFVIFITGSRAAYLGLAIGILYFIFLYPKRIVWLKIVAGLLLILGIVGIYYLNTRSTAIFSNTYILKHPDLEALLRRFSIQLFLDDPRFSGWQVALKALRERPVLGYGSENFAIGFDKYYDSSLPYITKEWGSWWDRAHNFIFDIALNAGIPALIIYVALFGLLIWELQKLKKKKPQDSLLYHSIQATFLGYLTANFFSFDAFSTYLISFLLIGFSLFLIGENAQEKVFHFNIKSKNFIIFFLFLVLIYFVWFFNLKPLKINAEINNASYFVRNENCAEAILRIEKILPQKTFLESYLRLIYFDFITKCEGEITGDFLEQTKEKINNFKEVVRIQPFYTRAWISLGSTTNVLIESENNPKNIEELKKEADSYFEKAEDLSPKRQEIYIEWAVTDLLTGDYQKAKEKSQKCIDLNNNLGDCYWSMVIANTYLGEFEKAKENIKIAEEKGYLINSEVSLLELARAYFQNKNYQELIEIYQKLVELKPENPTYHISLLVVLKEAGNFGEAKKEALKILELFPAYKEEIESFLKQLP